MKTEKKPISDYYPVGLDIATAAKLAGLNPQPVALSAGELIDWANKNHCTGLQTLTLLIKNAFEGHLCHLQGIPIEKLIESGTLHIDLAGEPAHKEFAGDFFRNLKDYEPGLLLAWQKVVAANPGTQELDFRSMLHFILANHLFRLPVSYLKDFDTNKFIHISAIQRNQFRLQYLLNSGMINQLAGRSFIDFVNEIYREKFKDILLRLQSKENVLMQLLTKLDYANDPSIESHEELDEKYFEFLVASKISRAEERKLNLIPEQSEFKNTENYEHLLKSKIRKLYKLIAKNCSEVHTKTEGQESYQMLRQYFMAANTVYKDFTNSFSNLMFQHIRLTLLLIKVINTRKINHLSVVFGDFTGLDDKQPLWLSDEHLQLSRNNLERNLEMLKIIHFTEFKMKYIRDEEMAQFHRDFLNNEVEFLNQRIGDVMKEINQVMQSKTKEIKEHFNQGLN